MKKQSSIEWLIEQFGIEEIVSDCKKEYRDEYIERINQAKQMHKQEIIEANRDGGIFFTEPSRQERADDYYKKTYEK